MRALIATLVVTLGVGSAPAEVAANPAPPTASPAPPAGTLASPASNPPGPGSSPAPPVARPAPLVSPSVLVPSCADDAVAPRLAHLLQAGRFADVHHAATTVRVMCGGVALDATRLLGAIALLRLEDREPALGELAALAADGAHRDTAALVLGWAHLANADREAAEVVLARVPAPRAAAVRALTALDDRATFERHLRQLPAAVQPSARVIAGRYHAARGKHPALAGVLSAVLPGAGQVYAGSWQAAAVTFVLNGLFVTATVELARDGHYFTAAAAGTAASFFYVGGIMNAVDLAQRRNELASKPHAADLERLLVPELDGLFGSR